MTFDNDFIVLKTEGRPLWLSCQSLGLDWPPPETYHFQGFKFTQMRRSQLTDDERAGLTHVCRGAEYQCETKENDLGIGQTFPRSKA